MIRSPRPTLVLAAALGLAGCASAPEATGSATALILEAGRGVLAQRQAPPQRLQPTPGFPGVDPALVAGVDRPLLGAWLSGRQALATLTLSYRQDDRTFWSTADGATLTLQGGGMVTATRGLGPDLQASDSAAVQALIAAGRAGQAERLYAFVDGTYREQELRLTCALILDGPETLRINRRDIATLRMTETCTGPGTEEPVVNRYWRDARGPRIIQSVQWLGPRLGAIHPQRLVE